MTPKPVEIIRASKIKYPIPFEIHVTVESAEREVFSSACRELGVKAIFLALQSTSAETVLNDVMTSSVLFGNNAEALGELERIAQGLTRAGFKVVRKKIETVPWHPAAPSRVDGISRMPPGGYFESHLNVVMQAEPTPEGQLAQREALQSLARAHNAHLSRNIFKILKEGLFTQMLTLRAYEGAREDFEAHRDALAQALKDRGFSVEKVITEFSIYDTKALHDAAWLSAA